MLTQKNPSGYNSLIKRVLSVLLVLTVFFSFSAVDSFAAAKVKAPGRVSRVSARTAGDTAVTIKWKKVKGAKGYAVYCDGDLVERVAGAKSVTYTVENLDPGTKYGFAVRAYRTYKTKKWLNTKTGKYQKKKPAKKYRGGSKTAISYKYGKYSKIVMAKTTGVMPVGKRSAASLDAATLQEEMLRQINAQRAAAGVAALETMPVLNELAMEKALDMYKLGYFDHFSPTWGSPSNQFAMHGIRGFYGENIAWGQETINEVMESWMNSPNHRSNILDPDYTHVGMAYYGEYWVQQFSRNPSQK